MVTGPRAAVVAVALLAACTSAGPPDPAAILVVHAMLASGPGGPGVEPTHGPAGGMTVTARARGGVRKTAITDHHGEARFVLPPGRYLVRLADRDCESGAPARPVHLPRAGTARVSLTCWGVG